MTLLMSLPVVAVSVLTLDQPAGATILPSETTEIKEVPAAATTMTQSPVQLDPLNSPHPVPWTWILTTHAEVSKTLGSGLRYYRTQSLISPDGKYAAYSRIQMQVQPELFRSHVNSVMFVENLQTGDLHTIMADSPLAAHPFSDSDGADLPGSVAILIPIAWSPAGDRILAREFEAMFSTSDASDYAVVWDRHLNRISTLAPSQINYTNAVLLGWSQTYPNRALFRAGNMGNLQWPLWAVDISGETVPAKDDKPVVFGRTVSNVWAGPQAHW
jgi:hypothetical protein